MRPPLRITTRRLLLAIALIAIGLGLWDRARQNERADVYRQRGRYCDLMVRKCREIVALSPAECARRDAEVRNDPYLRDQTWTGRMIPYFTELGEIYRRAADHPRDPLPPLPSYPD